MTRCLPAVLGKVFAHCAMLFMIAIPNFSDAQSSPPEGEAPFVQLQGGSVALERFGYIDWNARWRNPTISVCWEPGAEQFSAEKILVQQSIRTSLERHSALRFYGWATCGTGDVGIRIRIADENPQSQVGPQREPGIFGRELPTKMALNFAFQRWPCHVAREHCIVAIARHEFLHAVGVLHEHLRPDTPPQCQEDHANKPDFRGTRPVAVGQTFDQDSIMNYCNNIYSMSRPPDLSVIDAATIRYLYPPG
ncbi:M12 family metallopeptidase [Muricoccus aerilatus]|uniref:M12 family metallopeptidase n=1 Tax=Muricoccus aerilatus TaxID=452982 RepID=UPI0012EBD8D0